MGSLFEKKERAEYVKKKKLVYSKEVQGKRLEIFLNLEGRDGILVEWPRWMMALRCMI